MTSSAWFHTDFILHLYSPIHNAICFSAEKEPAEVYAYWPNGKRTPVPLGEVLIKTGNVYLLWDGSSDFDSLVCRNFSSRNDLDEIPDSDIEAQLKVLRAAGIYTGSPTRCTPPKTAEAHSEPISGGLRNTPQCPGAWRGAPPVF